MPTYEVTSDEAKRRVVHHRGHREHRVETKMADTFLRQGKRGPGHNTGKNGCATKPV